MMNADKRTTFRQHVRFYLGQSLIYGIGYVIARVLGALFSVIVARAFGPADFGAIRYAISLAGLAIIVVGPLPLMLSRYLAIYRKDAREVDRYFTNGIVLICVMLLFTLVGTGWYLRRETFSILLGTLLVICGMVAISTYMELNRGLDNVWRMMGSYVIANFIQLVGIVACVWALGDRSIGLGLAIYGLSFIFPIGFFELWKQPTVHLQLRLITLATIRQLGRFSVPLVIANASYTVWASLDLLLVEQHLGSADAGIYAAAKTAVMVFLFIPYAVTTATLPYFARGSTLEAHRSLLISLGSSIVISTILVAGFWGFSGPLVKVIFGQRYSAAAQPIRILAVGMAVYTLYLVFETWMVAKGYPWIHALAMIITMGGSTAVELALLPHWRLVGVALGVSLGITAGFLVMSGMYGWLVWRKREKTVSNAGSHLDPSSLPST
jgi:O-antigen/teichoic acid export membrane protein